MDSERYAQQVVDRLFERTFILKNLPKSGRIVPEYQHEQIRELIEGSYRLVYHLSVNQKLVIITSIYHSKRLFPESPDDFLNTDF